MEGKEGRERKRKYLYMQLIKKKLSPISIHTTTMQPSCPQQMQAWLSPALHWTACILVRIHPSLSRTMTVSKFRFSSLYKSSMVPGGLQSSQASWDPKGNKPDTCLQQACVCSVPLLLQSLGGFRCSMLGHKGFLTSPPN